MYLAIAWVLFPGSSRSGEKATKIVSLMRVCGGGYVCVCVCGVWRKGHEHGLSDACVCGGGYVCMCVCGV